MKIVINTIGDLYENINKIPAVVIEDINRRITDWLAAGEKEEDAYIKQQFRCAENIVNLS